MKSVIYYFDFSEYEIVQEYQANFKCKEEYLSNFEAAALCWAAEAIKRSADEVIFCDNQVWWDEGNERLSLFLTHNNILMKRNYTTEKMWRIQCNF